MMKRHNLIIKCFSLVLAVVFMLATLCSCDAIQTRDLYGEDGQVLFSTFDIISPLNRKAFSNANYELRITREGTASNLNGIVLVQEYVNILKFEVFQKNNARKKLAEYTVKVDEMGFPFCERDPYDVMYTDPVTKSFPLKMIEVLETWARFVALTHVKDGGLDLIEEKNKYLVNDVRLHATEELRAIVADYGNSLKPTVKDVLLEAATVSEYFMVDEGLEGWIKVAIQHSGDVPDYMDGDMVETIAEKMGDYMGIKAFTIIDQVRIEALLMISDGELQLCKKNIGICIDEMAEAIIAANNN